MELVGLLLGILAAIVSVVVGAIQLQKWWKEHRGQRAAAVAPPATEDKWVSIRYVEETGIGQRLRDQGYEFGWVAANDEARKIDIEGYEPVIDLVPNGRRVCYKVRDHPVVGGYLILLKRAARQS